MTFRRVSRATLAVLAVVAVLGMLPPVSTAQVNPDLIEGAIIRTVLLTLLVPVPGQERQLRSAGGCSGSFVTPSGLILTASHCVRATSDDPNRGTRKGELLNPAGLAAVSVHLQNQSRPVLMMLARYVADDPATDLAIIKVHSLVGQGGQQQGVPPDFRVPYLTVGDSDKLRHGEALAVIGFPGVGGETVTASQGHVTGFFADDQNRRMWVKLEAASGPGGSGGPVINGRGEQVAVLSGAKRDVESGARAIRAMVVNRMPTQWHEHFRSGGPGPGPGPAPVPAPAPAPAPAPIPAPQPAPAPAPGPVPPRPAPAPVPAPPSQSAHVIIQGRVLDAATGAGIQGGVVVLLRPGVSPRDATREDIVAGANTDGNGLFQTRPPVQRGFKYPLFVMAQGYQQLIAVLEIGPSGADAITLTIKLARQQ